MSLSSKYCRTLSYVKNLEVFHISELDVFTTESPLGGAYFVNRHSTFWKEETFSFPKHQKILKSIKNSSRKTKKSEKTEKIMIFQVKNQRISLTPDSPYSFNSCSGCFHNAIGLVWRGAWRRTKRRCGSTPSPLPRRSASGMQRG